MLGSRRANNGAHDMEKLSMIFTITAEIRKAPNRPDEETLRRVLARRLRDAFRKGHLSRLAWIQLLDKEPEVLAHQDDEAISDIPIPHGYLELVLKAGKNKVCVHQERPLDDEGIFQGQHGARMRRIFYESVGDAMNARLGTSKFDYTDDVPKSEDVGAPVICGDVRSSEHSVAGL